MTDKRYLQANKEAKLSLFITILYLLMWVISAYSLGDRPGIFGFPAWFELSCIFTPIAFIIICYLVVRYCFKDISLENASDSSAS